MRSRLKVNPENPESTLEDEMVSDSLGARKDAILMAVVAEHVRTAAPVGSQHVLRSTGLNLSSATVRTQMAELERDGYLIQPHVSSGRIPSVKGYRYFVDRLMNVDMAMVNRLRRAVEEYISVARGELDQILELSLTFLSRYSNYTALVATWTAVAERIRVVSLVLLNPDLGLLVVVGSRGRVERCTIRLGRAFDEATAIRVSNFLTEQLRDVPFSDEIEIVPSGDPELDALAFEAIAALRDLLSLQEAELRTKELARTAEALEELGKAAMVIDTLEDQLQVVRVVRRLAESGQTVSIGEESGLDAFSECSIVVAPCEVDGELVGSIGVLGPTRMDYPLAMSVVKATSAGLAQAV